VQTAGNRESIPQYAWRVSRVATTNFGAGVEDGVRQMECLS
jgi:hypothetical protein